MTKPPNRTKESVRQTMRQLMRAMDFASLIAFGIDSRRPLIAGVLRRAPDHRPDKKPAISRPPKPTGGDD